MRQEAAPWRARGWSAEPELPTRSRAARSSGPVSATLLESRARLASSRSADTALCTNPGTWQPRVQQCGRSDDGQRF